MRLVLASLFAFLVSCGGRLADLDRSAPDAPLAAESGPDTLDGARADVELVDAAPDVVDAGTCPAVGGTCTLSEGPFCSPTSHAFVCVCTPDRCEWREFDCVNPEAGAAAVGACTSAGMCIGAGCH